MLNRANARVQIFDNARDYQQFEGILEEAVKKYDIRLLAYCIMSNHWHLVLHPRYDGDLQAFMSWLTTPTLDDGMYLKRVLAKVIFTKDDTNYSSVNRISICLPSFGTLYGMQKSKLS